MDLPVRVEQDVASHFNQFGQLLKGWKLKAVKHNIWMVSVWAIWQARNKVLFEGTNVSHISVVNHIKHVYWGWFISGRERRSDCNFVDWLNYPLGYMSSLSSISEGTLFPYWIFFH